MSALREFVLERIVDDESAAQRLIDGYPAGYRWCESGPGASPYPNQSNPWRTLSGCVAKRLIVSAHRQVDPRLDRRARLGVALKTRACTTCGPTDTSGSEWACYTLRVLALHWVDHPDYRGEWRPELLGCAMVRA